MVVFGHTCLLSFKQNHLSLTLTKMLLLPEPNPTLINVVLNLFKKYVAWEHIAASALDSPQKHVLHLQFSCIGMYALKRLQTDRNLIILLQATCM